MIIRSIIEFAVIIFTIVALVNEERVAAWERRMARKFLYWLLKEDENDDKQKRFN